MLVAVGSDHKIYTNSDANTWVKRYEDTPGTFHDIVYANNIWTACGVHGSLVYSSDGVIWQEVLTNFPELMAFTALAASDTAYYAAALIEEFSTEPDRCVLYRSSDGQVWHSVTRLEAWYIRGMAWTGSEWVAIGDGNNYHLGMPDGVVFASSDGQQWNPRSTDAPYALNAAIDFGGDLIVGGGGGYILTGSESHYLTKAASGAEMTGVVWNGTHFVAVTGRGTTMFSPDGESWTEFHSGVSTNFSRLAWSGSAYVTLGGIGAATDIYTSPDGDTWTRTQAYDDVILNDVIWGGDQFVVCGRKGVIYRSPDGSSWSREFVGEEVVLDAVAWDGSRYLASDNDVIWTSPDGITWTAPVARADPPLRFINRLIWTGELYVGIGNDYSNPADPLGYVYTSTNGVSGWTDHLLGSMEKLHDIAWTGQRYIVCGRGGVLHVSTDAVDWQSLETGTEQTLTDIAIGTDRAVVVAGNRTVLVSP
jgi:hypothetical protein